MARWHPLLRKSERVVLVGVAVGAIFIALFVLVVEPLTGWLPALHDYVPTITLVLLSSFVLYYFGREQFMVEYTRWKALGIRSVYRSRTDNDQFDEYMRLLSGAEKDLFIVGITLKDLSLDHAPLLLDKARRGCTIRLLMLSPRYWRNQEPILDPVAAAIPADLGPNFQLAIAHIRALAMSMAEAKARMEVRFYHQAPTLSLTIVDGDSASGRMRVELTPHNAPGLDYFRPMLDLERAGSADLCRQFYQQYCALWDIAEPYLAVKDATIQINLAIDQELSAELDLPADWLPDQPWTGDSP